MGMDTCSASTGDEKELGDLGRECVRRREAGEGFACISYTSLLLAV